MNKRPKIVIVGAGFGGISLAKKLLKEDVEIVLIDKNNYHTFQPLLYQVATGGLEPNNIAYPIRRIFRNSKNFCFRMAKVKQVNFQKKYVETNNGNIDYDYLVLATGSTNNFFNFDGIKDQFYSLKSVSEALDIRNSLMMNLEKLMLVKDPSKKDEVINISIVGAGPTGVEISGALAEMKNKVLPKDYPEYDFSKMNIYLFEAADKVLSAMGEESSQYAMKYLTKLGVKVKLNTTVKDFDSHKIYLEDGTEYKSSTLIWTAGVKACPVNGIEEQKLVNGRIKVNEFNQVEGVPNVFAIGDVSAKLQKDTQKGLPMLAQVAIQQGNSLAKNILRNISNKAMKPFQYKDKGVMATIGKNKAVVELPRFKFQGVFAWFVWMFVHLMALVGFRNKLITFIDWTQNYFNSDRPLGAILRKNSKVTTAVKDKKIK